MQRQRLVGGVLLALALVAAPVAQGLSDKWSRQNMRQARGFGDCKPPLYLPVQGKRRLTKIQGLSPCELAKVGIKIYDGNDVMNVTDAMLAITLPPGTVVDGIKEVSDERYTRIFAKQGRVGHAGPDILRHASKHVLLVRRLHFPQGPPQISIALPLLRGWLPLYASASDHHAGLPVLAPRRTRRPCLHAGHGDVDLSGAAADGQEREDEAAAGQQEEARAASHPCPLRLRAHRRPSHPLSLVDPDGAPLPFTDRHAKRPALCGTDKAS